MSKKELENWEKEIKRLDKIRLDLGLTLYKTELLTGVKRGQLNGYFELKNIPSLKIYLSIKSALENAIEVKSSEEASAPLKTKKCDCKLVDGLLRRGKIKCNKTKEEHNF